MTAVRGGPTVWWLAFGYFTAYVFYSALVRAATSSEALGPPVSGLALLPGAALGTAITMTATIWLLGWWKYAGTRRVLGVALPAPRRSTLISGLSFALIIWTTGIAYSFPGISIVFALLLMRGGVLALAPIVDRLSGRRVHWDAWAALGLSLIALALAFSDVGNYHFSLAASLNLAAYLAGYTFRLLQMTWQAKAPDAAVNRRFFVEENMVAMVALVALPALVAAFGSSQEALQLRQGFAAALTNPLTSPSVLVGICYGILAVFGTLIYLEGSENTFCVVLNRGSSLLSGVIAAYGLVLLIGAPFVSARQLAATAIVLGAMAVLAVARLRPVADPWSPTAGQRIVLFVCGGNTSRSPMAQAICNSTLARRLQIPAGAMATAAPVRAISAGLTAEAGAPLSGHATRALATLGISGFSHAATPLTVGMIAGADVVYCMTASQQNAVIALWPAARDKVHRLEPDTDIPDPSGQPLDVFVDVANRIDAAVRRRMAALALAGA